MEERVELESVQLVLAGQSAAAMWLVSQARVAVPRCSYCVRVSDPVGVITAGHRQAVEVLGESVVSCHRVLLEVLVSGR